MCIWFFVGFFLHEENDTTNIALADKLRVLFGVFIPELTDIAAGINMLFDIGHWSE